MRIRFVIFPLLLFWAAGVVAQSVEPLLTLKVATDRELYLADARNTIYVETRVGTSAQASAAAPHTVRNIAFVLDRSGSMAGAPIQALRQTLSSTLNSLSERDIVSVILCGSEVETLIEAQRRDQLEGLDLAFAKIAPAGGSALYDAMNQGAAQLRRYAGPTTSNHLILITDGKPTKGPREFDDFSRLAEAFAREGLTISTIGLGQDFNEDLLAALARMGNGHFRFAAQPEKLLETVQAELAPLQTLIARDATLTVEFSSGCEKLTSPGWFPAAIKDTTATYRFPYVFAGQELLTLTSALTRAYRFSFDLAKIRLTWTDAKDDQAHELKTTLKIILDNDTDSIRRAANPSVIRTTVNALISGGMQEAIEQIDKGDFRRALRALRRARSEALWFNYDLDDAEITGKIHRLEAYLADVQARGMNQLDRKILRSGLFNQFDTPTADDAPER